ncbi:MAG TPA: phosphohistidine phosphatase SixA [Deinococcales bacterium]|nr:phosphohistidine phosphatase SixA [Deinococcales bacterium]
MDLYLIRHAEAEDRAEDQADAERALTRKGEKQARRVADALDSLDVRFDLLLTSPYRRALQTSEALEDIAERVEVEDRLAGPPDGGLVEKLRALGGPGAVIGVVGHEPHLGELCSLLLLGNTDSARRFALAKSGLIALEWPDPACVKFALTPKLVKRLA